MIQSFLLKETFARVRNTTLCGIWKQEKYLKEGNLAKEVGIKCGIQSLALSQSSRLNFKAGIVH